MNADPRKVSPAGNELERARLRPNLSWQSALFMIGSSLFAVGTAIGALAGEDGAHLANVLCFIGAWFFTSAGLVQVYLSGPLQLANRKGSAPTALNRAWMAAVTQSAGTILFNVSTTAALIATSVRSQREFMWSPDAGGSVCCFW